MDHGSWIMNVSQVFKFWPKQTARVLASIHLTEPWLMLVLDCSQLSIILYCYSIAEYTDKFAREQCQCKNKDLTDSLASLDPPPCALLLLRLLFLSSMLKNRDCEQSVLVNDTFFNTFRPAIHPHSFIWNTRCVNHGSFTIENISPPLALCITAH